MKLQNDVFLDLETRSRLNIRDVGAHKLAEDPELQILSAHYAIGDAPVRHWRGAFSPGPGDFADPEADPHFVKVLDAIEADANVWAHNAPFDFAVWNACAERYGFPGLRLEQMRDSAAVCRSLNLPGALGNVAKMLGLQKLENRTYHPLWKIGKGGRHCAEDMRALYEEMLTYGDKDVEVMREILNSVPIGVDWGEYLATERINQRGVAIDLDWCARAVQRKDAIVEQVNAALDELTCGAVTKTTASAKARVWVEQELLRVGLLDPDEQICKSVKKRRKNDVTFYTEQRPAFDKAVRRELREDLLEFGGDEVAHIIDLLDAFEEGASAAVSKYQAALNRTCADGRLRGMYVFNGAQQTGRYTSNGMQTHNLKRAKVKGSVKAAQDKARSLEEIACLLRATITAGD